MTFFIQPPQYIQLPYQLISPLEFPGKAKREIPKAELTITLPRQQYKSSKIVLVPFDSRMSHNGRFDTLGDAMLFISKHCIFHHSCFTKKLAKMYLPFCKILSFTNGGYETPIHVMKKEFNAAFNAAQKNLHQL